MGSQHPKRSICSQIEFIRLKTAWHLHSDTSSGRFPVVGFKLTTPFWQKHSLSAATLGLWHDLEELKSRESTANKEYIWTPELQVHQPTQRKSHS